MNVTLIETTNDRRAESRPGRVSPADRDQARCLVADYLRDWGLRDPEFVAEKSRQIVERAECTLPDSMSPAEGEWPRPLFRHAISITARDVESAIAVMTSRVDGVGMDRQVASDHVPAAASAALGMSSILAECPEVIVARDAQARLATRMQAATASICPVTRPGQMRPQPRTRLWNFMRRGYRQLLLRRLRNRLWRPAMEGNV